MKTTRIGVASQLAGIVGGVARLAGVAARDLLEFLPDPLALQPRQMIDEEHAVQMVDFMLHGAGEEFFAADVEEFAFDVLRADDGFVGAFDLFAEAGDGQAAFLADLRAFELDDLRVDQDEPIVGIRGKRLAVGAGYCRLSENTAAAGHDDSSRCRQSRRRKGRGKAPRKEVNHTSLSSPCS